VQHKAAHNLLAGKHTPPVLADHASAMPAAGGERWAGTTQETANPQPMLVHLSCRVRKHINISASKPSERQSIVDGLAAGDLLLPLPGGLRMAMSGFLLSKKSLRS
jgi:hypothetical protein